MLKGRKTYILAALFALLPIVLNLVGLNEDMTIREIIEHFTMGGGLAALRAGVASVR